MKAGVSGIILALIYLVINIPLMLLADKAVGRRPGYAGVAMCSVAGIALVVPKMLGEAYADYCGTAIAQCALALIITAIVSPLITKLVVKKWGAPCTIKNAAAAK